MPYQPPAGTTSITRNFLSTAMVTDAERSMLSDVHFHGGTVGVQIRIKGGRDQHRLIGIAPGRGQVVIHTTFDPSTYRGCLRYFKGLQDKDQAKQAA